MRTNNLVSDIKQLFDRKNSLTEYMNARGGDKIFREYKHFVETPSYDGLIKAFAVLEDEAIDMLKVVDPTDHARIAKLQMVASIKDAIIELVSQFASLQVEAEEFGVSPKTQMV